MAQLRQRSGDRRQIKGKRLVRHRLFVPACLVSAVAVGGVAAVSVGAAGGATPSRSSSSTPTTVPLTSTKTTAPSTAPKAGSITQNNTTARSKGAGHPVGQPSGRIYVTKNGQLVAYGNHHTIIYSLPPNSYIPAGQALFAQDCSSCHGANAQGTQFAPNLVGLGPATINFWITTGRMPAKNPLAVQAQPKPPELTNKQALEVAAYVNSLDPATPFIPKVNVKNANLAEGADLFSINCAACHTITGAGDALAKNTFAPSLHMNGQPTATQVAEAIRTGPANMPRFNGGNLTDAQVASIVAYVVKKIQHPSNPGGFGLGGIGPVTEGFVGLLFGVGGMMLIAYWTGDRTAKEDEEGEPEEEATHPEPEPVGGGHE